jgi:hypothetical protein
VRVALESIKHRRRPDQATILIDTKRPQIHRSSSLPAFRPCCPTLSLRRADL